MKRAEQKQATINKYLNKTFVTCDGDKFTVIEYFDYKNLTIKFSDGLIIKNVSTTTIRMNYIRHPEHKKDYRGKARTNLLPHENVTVTPYGLSLIGKRFETKRSGIVEIIAYHSAIDVDVKFLEDGTIRKGVPFCQIRSKCLRNPNKIVSQKILSSNTLDESKVGHDSRTKFNRVGLKFKNRHGEEYTITAYRNSYDCDVIFSDGSVRKHLQWFPLSKGQCLKVKLDNLEDAPLEETQYVEEDENSPLPYRDNIIHSPNPHRRFLCGIADMNIKTHAEFVSKIKNSNAFRLWYNMIREAYSGFIVNKKHFTVSVEFLNFKNFEKFYNIMFSENEKQPECLKTKGNVFSKETIKFYLVYNFENNCVSNKVDLIVY